MTGELFAVWIRRVDNRMRRQNRHILFFLDNCGAHPHMELKNVKVVLPPPNKTSKLQPMDAGIIQNLKMVYRKKLLRHIIFLMDAASMASDIAKKDTVLDAILWLTSAWDSVKPETISKCFQKCGFSEALLDAATTDDDEWDDVDLLPLLPHGITFKDYVASDNKVAMQTTISEDWESELVASARAIKDGGGRDYAVSSCEEDEGEDSLVIPWATAWSHSTELLDYAVATNNPALIALFSQARELIQQDCHKAIDSRRQTSMLLLFTNK